MVHVDGRRLQKDDFWRRTPAAFGPKIGSFWFVWNENQIASLAIRIFFYQYIFPRK